MTNTAKQNVASDYTTEQKIVFLYDLQKLESKIDEINFIKGELPAEVADLEDEVEGLKTRIANLVAKIDELSKASKASKESIEESKSLIKKYSEQQNSVRNNREFESISKEIEYQELEIELAEKHIKEFSVEVKDKKSKIEIEKAKLADKELSLKEKQQELAKIDEETAGEIAELEAKAKVLSAKIEDRLLNAFNKIRANMKNGVAVATVKRNACGGCFNRIPPQRQLDIRMSKKVIVCEYCGRILVSDLLEDSAE